MFELAFLACLSANPTYCRDFQLTYVGNVPMLTECALFSQPELAKWTIGNPNWKIKKYKCGPAEMDKREI
jgi:hypothetical protein